VPGSDPGQQVLPRGRERVGSLALQLAGQGGGVDAGLGEGGDDLVGVSAVGGQELADRAVVGNASRVRSGMVSTVNGGVSASSYSTSGASGSLTEVEAHSSRCAQAPSLASRNQRGESSSSRYAR
jgi:hypothetical protein